MTADFSFFAGLRRKIPIVSLGCPHSDSVGRLERPRGEVSVLTDPLSSTANSQNSKRSITVRKNKQTVKVI